MRLGDKTALICDCGGTMSLDAAALAKACGGEAGVVEREACRAGLARFSQALAKGQPMIVACRQEETAFSEVAAAAETAPGLRFVDIRDRAGWSDEGVEAGPKIAALLAEAALEPPPTPLVALASQGACLVYGPGEAAMAAATRLAGRLSPRVVMSDDGGEAAPPARLGFPVMRGRVARLAGALGDFTATIEGPAALKPEARARFEFTGPGEALELKVDLVLDLTGGAPLVSGHRARDGYVRPDPGDPRALAEALFDLSELVGEFDKPRYVGFEAALCAHSRSAKTGCANCLDACPAGAISSAGDEVAIDPRICGGCGLCGAVCPTGAASYQLPGAEFLGLRLKTLIETYRTAGGVGASLLIHDGREGVELISAMARLGRGLPARMLPVEVNEASAVGLDALMTGFALGAVHIALLIDPRREAEAAPLREQIEVANAILEGLGAGPRAEILAAADPDALEAALWAAPRPEPAAEASFASPAEKRTRFRVAAAALHAAAKAPPDAIALPSAAPFGRVVVDEEGCTLCLACVAACPANALQDNPDRPELRFQEDACVQCGICAATCPEGVIALKARLSFDQAARRPVSIKAEEPFHCVRCGAAFGTKSSIERMIATLADKHAMFQGAGAEALRMCGDCKVSLQFERGDNPLGGAPRPRPRTTDDYLAGGVGDGEGEA